MNPTDPTDRRPADPKRRPPRIRQGLGPRGGPRIPLEPEEAAARYAAGESVGAIAAEFGCTSWTVRARLREAGLPPGRPGRRRVP
jgi:hypothetical protein